MSERDNRLNKELRACDEGASFRLRRERDLIKTIIAFRAEFPDNDACDKKLLEWKGWEEVQDGSVAGEVVLLFDCSKDFETDCSSRKAIKIRRDEPLIPRRSKDEFPSVVIKSRWVYQCKGCGKQFGLCKDTIFHNRKGTDLWIWFLSLYVMFLLEGKMPRTWLKEVYLDYLFTKEGTIRSEDEAEQKTFERKITERIRRVTSEISKKLFSENTDSRQFLAYRKLVGFGEILFFDNYEEVLAAPAFKRRKWKIAIRKKEYSKNNKELQKYKERTGIANVHRVQYLKDRNSCEVGDWILRIKNSPDHPRGYLFNWICLAEILPLKPKYSQCNWQAIQIKKIPRWHFRPFRLTADFKDAFVKAINDYRNEEGRELPLNEIMDCPHSIKETIAFEFPS